MGLFCVDVVDPRGEHAERAHVATVFVGDPVVWIIVAPPDVGPRSEVLPLNAHAGAHEQGPVGLPRRALEAIKWDDR